MWSIFSRTAACAPKWGSSGLAERSRTALDFMGQATGIRGFKVVSALRRRCRSCRIVQRGKKTYVLCLENPRHKQRNGKGGSRYAKS